MNGQLLKTDLKNNFPIVLPDLILLVKLLKIIFYNNGIVYIYLLMLLLLKLIGDNF